VLLASVQSSHNGALREHKERCYLRRVQHALAVRQLMGSFATGHEALTTIQAITTSATLSDTEKVTQIRALLVAREAQRLLDTETLAALQASVETKVGDEEYYNITSQRAVGGSKARTP